MNEQYVRTLRVIWIALVNSILIYFAVAYFAIRPETPKPVREAILELPVQIIYGLALLTLALSAIVPRMLLRAENGKVADGRVRLAFVVRWSLAEAVCIFGLLAALIGQSPGLFAPPAVVSLTALLLAFPSDSAIESYQQGA